ncbi:MAG: 4Fe-4S binding protein [Zestosphaera sp.]
MSEGHMLPLSRPVVGVSGRTGTWRIQRPVFDASKCIKCRLCWLYCPDSVIDLNEVSDDFVSIDYDYCKGCGICVSVCPTKALLMKPEG